MPTVRLRPAADDLADVETLLAETDLPSEDLRDGAGTFFVGVSEDDERAGGRVGVGGIENHGDVGLLRSVVVEPELRGEGYGTALCAALEGRARADGVDTLYLLTTTAADFFASRGYEQIERSAAPAAIRETTQFAQLCPDAAVCMRKPIVE